MSEILSSASGKEIKWNIQEPEALKAYIESAYITMKLAKEGKMDAQTVVKDDGQTVYGRPGLKIAEWAKKNIF
ncbi:MULTISPECIES: hypothetical protein [Sphingobacterium]|uniref:hypothetical protein n=1 Tax=Sphingobacterium TaxID=28453 RepID=UPI00257EA1F9|nr:MULTISPECIES: hypothetical protein [Sphingobacterium]